MSSPGVGPTSHPTVGPVLSPVHSSGFKDFFHRNRAHQQTRHTVRHFNARENDLFCATVLLIRVGRPHRQVPHLFQPSDYEEL